MPKNHLNYDEIQDAYLDSLIRLAFLQKEALQAQQFVEDAQGAPKPDRALRDETFARFEKRQHALEKMYTRAQKRKSLRRVMPKIIEIAACIVLLLGVATPIAVANIESIRVRVMKLLIDIQDDHTELALVEDPSASFDVPANWRGEYYPAYIPEGYALEAIDPYFNTVQYTNAHAQSIYFDEYTDEEANIDTENASLSYEDINGARALVIEKDGYAIVWSANNRYFTIYTNEPRDTALQIARSVQRINK